MFRRLSDLKCFMATAVAYFGCAVGHHAIATEPGSPPPQSTSAEASPEFYKDIAPILIRKCVTCHACYDAPCQLVMTAPEGLARGATKHGAYDSERLSPATPTRLFVDAQRTVDWRKLGFFSVLGGTRLGQRSDTSSLMSMLRLGHANPFEPNKKVPFHVEFGLHRKNACPLPSEFTSYAALRPEQGMPLATTGLTDREYELIETWVADGARVTVKEVKPTALEREMIKSWETFLNQSDTRTALIARYLFEHLFLAHLYFDAAGNGNFFVLERSRTPPGEPIHPVASRRPNDDPAGRFYYRLRLLNETLVHKTHVTYYAGREKLERIKELFLTSNWSAGALPLYGAANAANPFETFRAIPAKARYQFLLDNAEFFVRSFIRGPACRGQAATDVIRDHFWVLFQRPASDPFISNSEYQDAAIPLLGLPGEDDNLWQAGPEWLRYRDARQSYLEKRRTEYQKQWPLGPSLEDIWDGQGRYRGALLTVFRHFDNASVVHGFVGNYPSTMWVMDYAILERTYYGLVVNFDVFGNVAHQLQTRLYFDLIRRESELNYLRFLPPDIREVTRLSWYQGLASLRLELTYAKADTTTPTRVKYRSPQPRREFADQVLKRQKGPAGRHDPINRCLDGPCKPMREVFPHQVEVEEALRRLVGKPLSKAPYIAHLPDITLLTVELINGMSQVYSIIRNRAHTDVAFIMYEDLRLEPEKDSLTIIRGVAGSYPNFMFRAKSEQLEAFTKELLASRSPIEFDVFVKKWGIRRTHPEFWQILHGVTEYLKRTTPIQSGILDINRYKNL